MLQYSYLGIAFALVFYLVFGITVRIMELTDQERNKARLTILITSLSLTTLSSFFAGYFNIKSGKILVGVPFMLLSTAAFIVLAAILFELHHIQTKRRMRKFMILFDIVDRFINEGKTREEILHYLIEIQKLTKKEAMDFLEFISDPQNYQFLQDVNEKIHEAQLLKGVRK